MNLSPLPVQKFFDSNGRPMVGGLLFTYGAGTTTKIATYKDQAGTPNTNPVVLDYRGEANVWLDQTLTYKFVLSPEGDTDPPTRQIWTVDNISAAVTYASLNQQIIGQILFPRTAAEIVAGVTPANYAIPSHDAVAEVLVARYGTNTVPGTTEMYAPIANALLVAQVLNGAVVQLEEGKFKVSLGELVVSPGCTLRGSGSGIVGGSTLNGTTIVHANPGAGKVAVTLGTSDIGLSYGCGLESINIFMTQANTIGFVTRATVDASIRNVMVVGDQLLQSYTGIEIRSGSSVSSFANTFENVYCIYMHKCLRFVDIGGTFTTTSVFVNFQGFAGVGVDPTSIGVEFTGLNGLNSVFYGGNLESLGTAVKFANTTQGTSWFGMRFELNTVDVDWGVPVGVGRNSFYSPGFSFVEAGTRGDNNVVIGQFFGDVRISRGKTGVTGSIAIGDGALQGITGGSGDNVAVGRDALLAALTSSNNCGVGANALKAATSSNNVAVGRDALTATSSGGQNTGVGQDAGSAITTGGSNTAVGRSAQAGTTGSANTAVGVGALAGSTGSNNLALGQDAGTASSPHTIAAGENNRIVAGNSSISNAYIQVAWTVVSDVRDKRDIVELAL